MVKWEEEKKKKIKVDLLLVFYFSSSLFPQDQIIAVWFGDQIYLLTFRGSKSVHPQFCNDSVLSALRSFGPQHFSVPLELF